MNKMTPRSRTNPHNRNENMNYQEEAQSKRSEQHSKQTTHEQGMMLNQVSCMTRLHGATHGKRCCIQEHHIKSSLNEAGNNT